LLIYSTDMPVEIREIVIKTTIQSSDNIRKKGVDSEKLEEFRKRVLEECRRMIGEQKKLNGNRR